MPRLIARLGIALALVLALSAPVGTSTASAEGSNKIGRATAADQKFLRGCNRYKFRYEVRVATDNWSGYIQLYSPSGKKVTGSLIDDGPNTPRTGVRRLRLCHQSWRPGRWKVALKLIYTVGGEKRTGRSKPHYFRLYN